MFAIDRRRTRDREALSGSGPDVGSRRLHDVDADPIGMSDTNTLVDVNSLRRSSGSHPTRRPVDERDPRPLRHREDQGNPAYPDRTTGFRCSHQSCGGWEAARRRGDGQQRHLVQYLAASVLGPRRGP